MNKYHRIIESVHIGHPVVLNLGLGPPKVFTPAPQSDTREYTMLTTFIRETKEAWRGPTRSFYLPKTTEDDEPTLVQSGTFAVPALSTLFFDFMIKWRVDCIALHYPTLGLGYLLGPHSDNWGDFDMSLFKQLPKGEKPC
jgi:hypothetical protein